MDDFDLMCLHEHYAEYWYEYEDIDDETNNQPTVLETDKDTNISLQFTPRGTGTITFNF